MKMRFLVACALLAGCAGFQSNRPPPQPELPTPQAKVGDARTRAKAHTDLGMIYFQGGRMAVALEEARIALEADSGYAPAYNLRGLVRMNLRENAPAQSDFEQALRLAPNDPEINNNFGWFLCTLGREQDGIRHLMTAAKNPLYNTPTRPYTNAGLCAMRLKDAAAAEEYFRQAVIADGGNAQALYQLADLRYRRGDYAEAQRFVAEVNRLIEPTAESVWLALRIERRLGDRQAEAAFASRLRRNFSGSREYQALMQGQFD